MINIDMEINKKENLARKLSDIMNEEKQKINSFIINGDWDLVREYLAKSFSTAKALRKVVK